MRNTLTKESRWSPDTSTPPRPETRRLLRVLVVDDDEDLRELYRIGLEASAFDCDTACDGKTALALCAQRQYDVILMDYHLPDMNGCDTTRRIRLLPQYETIPIVGCSAADGIRNSCHAAGMNGFLSKPVSVGELVKTLHGITVR